MDSQGILQQLAAQDQLRSLETLEAAGGRFCDQAGREWLNFCSNDYLDLARSPELKQAATEATERYGTGTGSSRLLSGHLRPHQDIEMQLARWGGYEAALSFGSGYLANLGVLVGLLGPGDHVLLDRLNHASLIDGLRLAHTTHQCTWSRYKHADMADLEAQLQRYSSEAEGRKAQTGRIWIITESVFSMDGDIAPLQAIALLARHYGAHWIVDEAHGIGVFGPQGAGCSQHLSRELRPDVITANFSKALGSYGGFCLCSESWKQVLINRARSLIYSTALPAACVAAASRAIAILEQGDTRLGEQLMQRAEYFYQLLQPLKDYLRSLASPIIPVIMGENRLTQAVAARLHARGIWVKAIRPPTVPAGTARLRFSLNLAHRKEDLAYTAHCLLRAVQQEKGT